MAGLDIGRWLPRKLVRPIPLDATTQGPNAASFPINPGQTIDLQFDIQSIPCDRNRGDRSHAPLGDPAGSVFYSGVPPYLDGFIHDDVAFSVDIYGANMGWGAFPANWDQLFPTQAGLAVGGAFVYLFGSWPVVPGPIPIPFRIPCGCLRVLITGGGAAVNHIRYGLHLRSC